MKEFFLKLINSEDIKKEATSLEAITAWAAEFNVTKMDKAAIDELIDLIQLAEDKSKIALMDLLRLLFLHEHAVDHILNKHWCSLQESIIGYLMCFDLNSDDGKALANFHIISLKAFCNIYATEAGKTFMQGEG